MIGPQDGIHQRRAEQLPSLRRQGPHHARPRNIDIRGGRPWGLQCALVYLIAVEGRRSGTSSRARLGARQICSGTSASRSRQKPSRTCTGWAIARVCVCHREEREREKKCPRGMRARRGHHRPKNQRHSMPRCPPLLLASFFRYSLAASSSDCVYSSRRSGGGRGERSFESACSRGDTPPWVVRRNGRLFPRGQGGTDGPRTGCTGIGEPVRNAAPPGGPQPSRWASCRREGPGHTHTQGKRVVVCIYALGARGLTLVSSKMSRTRSSASDSTVAASSHRASQPGQISHPSGGRYLPRTSPYSVLIVFFRASWLLLLVSTDPRHGLTKGRKNSEWHDCTKKMMHLEARSPVGVGKRCPPDLRVHQTSGSGLQNIRW